MKREEVDYNKLSPMMKQYIDIKSKYQNELLFFRLGDFYELFFEDGMLASRELELTLTGKNAGLEERIPMCGVPYHSVKPYIEKLLDKGYKVAICEQMEDPKATKGMVKREVINVLTKSTNVDLDFLDKYSNNYIGSVIDFKYNYVLSYVDISTGSLYSIMIPHIKDKLINEILTLNIKELVLPDASDINLIDILESTYGLSVNVSTEYLNEKYENLYENIDEQKIIISLKHLFYYLDVVLMKNLSHLNKVILVNPADYLDLDVHTVRNLELIETMRLKERNNSLIWLIDKAKTAMGSRMLKKWLLKPLKSAEDINKRYDAIEKLNNEFLLKEELRNDLYEVYDIERLCGKIVCGNFNAKDALQIKNSLKVLPDVKRIIKELDFKYDINDKKGLFDLLDKAIYEDPPFSIKEGYLIKDGYSSELDELKNIRSGGKQYIASIEEKLRNDTGIKNLKVGFNKVFGYFIEISKGQIKNVDNTWGWERRQTLTDKERYINPELKEKEALILNAEERIIELEYNLFMEIKEKLKTEISSLQLLSNTISELDALASLSVVSEDNNFIRPTLTNEHKLYIKDNRHPVIERLSKNPYVPNDILMDEDVNTLLITGPNMAGKSTYMRQVAIAIILAQMGSFVPASEAIMPIFDKIFTRIGASDDLVSGESTFMVEMIEASNAIVNATNNSLILFDELGRGTATFDGMSLASAILEYVNNNIKCKTLFSTHYHELTNLEQKYSGIKNVHVAAHEENGNLTFLHKVQDGSVDKSYGIHVAKLANLPIMVINRANEILKVYENKPRPEYKEQISLDFNEEKVSFVKERLKEIDPMMLTPLEAMNILFELKELEKKEE